MSNYIRKALSATIAVLAAILLVIWSGLQPTVFSYAAEYTAYDRTAIEEDLREVDVSAYPKDQNGTHRLLDDVGFMEYGFSKSAFIAENYFGIYFYVYNPTEKAVSERAGSNVVNMAVEYGADGEPTKYENCALTLLSHTSNHRFYKFRLTENADVYARVSSYSNANEGKRRYDIGGIQLWFSGDKNATDSFVGQDGISYTYYCTGYAAGCGVSGSDESTLKVEKEELNALSLEVKHTYFQPEGTNGKDIFTHDRLSSVYFAVPKTVIEKYGEMTRIKGQYLKALTSEIFVTGNEKYYDEFMTVVGKDVGWLIPNSNDFESLIYAIEKEPLINWFGGSFTGNWFYNYVEELANAYPEDKHFSRLNYVIKAKNGDADTYDVSGKELTEYMDWYTKNVGASEEKVSGYAKSLFEWVDEEPWVFDLTPDNKTETLTSMKISRKFWQSAMNIAIEKLSSEYYEGKQALHLITDDDFVINPSTDEALKEPTSKNIYVNKNDVEDLYAFYKSHKENYNVYLIRYAVDDFVSAEGVEAHFDKVGKYLNGKKCLVTKNDSDTNCYLAKEYVYLDFEFIETEFTKNGQSTVLPVVMSPIDIIQNIDHPSVTIKDYDRALIWWLVGIAAGTLVCAIIAELARKG